MHPQIRQPKPGSCPLCGMDLVPVSQDEEEDSGSWALTLSPHAQKLASIEVATVERRAVSREISLVGKVTPDEKRLRVIASWVPGRIDRLFVDFTGIRVREGDHMVEIYSPELRTAQVELVEAFKAHARASQTMKPSAQRRLDAAREKLRLAGVRREQIERIESSAEVSDRLTLFAPIGGIVLQKHVMEGAYVQTGSPIYTIADLGSVWVQLDAYESDLEWLHYGQEVAFEVEAFPGEIFRGRVVFVDPVIDPTRRTASVRVNVDNPGFRLKPEMFVKATVWSELDASGRVKPIELAGKWVCPMHPEEFGDAPGTCTICGMDLVPAEDEFQLPARSPGLPLVIPKTAPLLTGRRAVVYVAMGRGRFEGREVRLGHRAGDVYVVLDGLDEGERVVTNGNFKIDSEMQIRGLNSMMYPPEASDSPEPGGQTRPDQPIEASEAFSTALTGVWKAYFDMHDALSHDRFEPARVHARALFRALDDTVSSWPAGTDGSARWAKTRKTIDEEARKLADASDLAQARALFEPLSQAMLTVVEAFVFPDAAPVYRYHCPMAFDNKGADWLQPIQGTANPYYGSGMFSCGSLVKTYGAEAQSERQSDDP